MQKSKLYIILILIILITTTITIPSYAEDSVYVWSNQTEEI